MSSLQILESKLTVKFSIRFVKYGWFLFFTFVKTLIKITYTCIRNLMMTCTFKAHSSTIPSQNSDAAKGIRIYFWTTNYSGRLQILILKKKQTSYQIVSSRLFATLSIESVLTVRGQRVEKMQHLTNAPNCDYTFWKCCCFKWSLTGIPALRVNVLKQTC